MVQNSDLPQTLSMTKFGSIFNLNMLLAILVVILRPAIKHHQIWVNLQLKHVASHLDNHLGWQPCLSVMSQGVFKLDEVEFESPN